MDWSTGIAYIKTAPLSIHLFENTFMSEIQQNNNLDFNGSYD